MNLGDYKKEMREYVIQWYKYHKENTPHGYWHSYLKSLGFKYPKIIGELIAGRVLVNIEHLYCFAKSEGKTPSELLKMIEIRIQKNYGKP